MNTTKEIVIIDDEVGITRLLKDFIEVADIECSIHTFNDPVEGLHYIQNSTVDIVITDYYMPTLNGIELLKKIDPHIKKVLISGMLATIPKEVYDDIDMVFFDKPVPIEALEQIIREETNVGCGSDTIVTNAITVSSLLNKDAILIKLSGGGGYYFCCKLDLRLKALETGHYKVIAFDISGLTKMSKRLYMSITGTYKMFQSRGAVVSIVCTNQKIKRTFLRFKHHADTFVMFSNLENFTEWYLLCLNQKKRVTKEKKGNQMISFSGKVLTVTVRVAKTAALLVKEAGAPLVKIGYEKIKRIGRVHTKQ